MDHYLYDAGEVAPTTREIRRVFLVTNNTDRTVTLMAIPTCACIASDQSTYTLASRATVPATVTLTIGAIAGVAKYDVRLLAEGIAPVDLSIRCHVSRSTTVSPSAIDLGPVAAASTHHRRIVVSTRKSERNALLATEGIETLRAVLSAPDTHNRVCFDVSLVAPLTPGPFSGSVSVRLLDTKEALTLPVRGTVLPALMLSPSYLVFDGSAERQIDIGTPSGHPANAPPSVLGLPTGLRSRTEHVPPKNWRMYFECDASAEPGAYECTVVLGQHEARLYLEIL